MRHNPDDDLDDLGPPTGDPDEEEDLSAPHDEKEDDDEKIDPNQFQQSGTIPTAPKPVVFSCAQLYRIAINETCYSECGVKCPIKLTTDNVRVALAPIPNKATSCTGYRGEIENGQQLCIALQANILGPLSPASTPLQPAQMNPTSQLAPLLSESPTPIGQTNNLLRWGILFFFLRRGRRRKSRSDSW